MSRIYTYNDFLLGFMTRRENDMLNPKFNLFGDIKLPKGSLIHYMPKSDNDDGPSMTEAFISNYPGEVFINFQSGFTPIMGSGRFAQFTPTDIIKMYRNKHFNYKWVRDIKPIYTQETKLVVENHALATRGYVYVFDRFLAFYKAYNNTNMLVDRINECAYTKRHQFVRMDLPVNMPSWKQLNEDAVIYMKRFKDGKPVIENSVIRTTKAEDSYWLLDWLLFLLDKKEYSLFSKLDESNFNNVNLMFCSTNRVWIINLGTLMGWFNLIKGKEQKVLAATRRFYLNLINLVNGTAELSELIESEDNVEENRRELDRGTPEVQTDDGRGSEKTRLGPSASQPSKDEEGQVSDTPSSVADLFRRDKADNKLPEQTPSSASSGLPEPSVPRTSKEEGSAATEEPEYEPLNWLSPIEDSLLEPVLISAGINTKKDVFSTPEAGIELALEGMAREGNLTVKQREYFRQKALSYKEIVMPNGQTMEEFIKVTDEELKDMGGEIIGEFPTVKDKTMLRSRAEAFRNNYPKKIMHKHIAASILNLQNAGIIIADYQVDRVEDIEGAYNVLRVQTMPVNGAPGVRVFPIPEVDEYGFFKVDGDSKYFQTQRIEKPIRKVGSDRVVLTSHYDKKVNLYRSRFAVDNYQRWLVRNINVQAKLGNLIVSNGNVADTSVESPRYVSMLASRFSSIEITKWKPGTTQILNFNTPVLLKDNPEWKSLCNKNSWVIGVYRNKPILINNFGIVSWEEHTWGGMEEILGISMAKSPIEYSVTNINGYLFPTGVVLCFYFGIDELLKILKSEYRVIPAGQRFKPSGDQFVLRFNDESLVFNKRDQLSTLVFGGMSKLDKMSSFSRADLNTKGVWVPLMGDPKVRATYFTEMDNLFKLFIDPITKARLKRMKYSTSFHYLMIDAVKLLMNDQSEHEVEINEQVFICYERFVSHIYSEFCKSNRQFQNKADTGKQTFDLNPQAIITNIITDQAAGSKKDMSPFQEAKSQEDVTFGGFKGRSEETMVKHTRSQLRSYKGLISEANKDNGKVGFVGYMTSDPRIEDFLGMVDQNEVSKGSQLFSVLGNLKYGTTLDDPKRSSFSTIQPSHAISARNYTANIVRTGGDNVLAHRLSDTYAKTAKRKATVTSITEKAIIITYEDGSTDACGLGLKIGKSEGSVYRHTLITDFKVGDPVNPGDVIAWDDEWFVKDPYCPGQVSVKTGRMTRALFNEDQTNYEDSLEFSRNLANDFVTPVLKEFNISMNMDEVIRFKKKIGDPIDYDTILCEISDPNADAFEDDDADLMNLNRVGIKQYKSTHHGRIIQIDVSYNGVDEDMSDTVRKLIKHHDREQFDLSKQLGKGAQSRRVGVGINVKTPSLPYGRLVITIYIESLETGVISNKYVLGNQMKGTTGYIVEEEMVSEDGRPIPLKFSFKSMFKRMVMSLRNKAVVTEFSYAVKDKFINICLGKE